MKKIIRKNKLDTFIRPTYYIGMQKVTTIKNFEMKIFSVIAVVALVTANLLYPGDISTEMLAEKGVLIRSVGADEWLMVINSHDENGENGTYWFILAGLTGNRKIGANLSALMEVSELLVSPQGNYLAVLSVGEGHPFLEIIDLKKLRQDNRCVVLHSIDPYPGSVWVKRWESTRLILGSTVPLTLRKKDGSGRVDPALILPGEEEFSFDMESGEMASSTFDIRELMRYFLSRLTHESPGVRIETAYSLKALGAAGAVDREGMVNMVRAIEGALEQEKDPVVIKALKETLQFLKSALQ
jgi:hypothetical protein